MISGGGVTSGIPSIVTGVTWSITASTGSSCTASGSGNTLNNTVSIAAGGELVYILDGTISILAVGPLEVSVTVTLPSGIIDPTPANNTATDSTTVNPYIPPTGGAIYLPLIIRGENGSASHQKSGSIRKEKPYASNTYGLWWVRFFIH